MKEFTVFRAHNLANPIGALQVNDDVARELAAHFKDHDSVRMGAGYTKSGNEIEIMEMSFLIPDRGQGEPERERRRVAKFLQDVLEASTRGASGLMERAIKAVEDDEMSDPLKVAQPSQFES